MRIWTLHQPVGQRICHLRFPMIYCRKEVALSLSQLTPLTVVMYEFFWCLPSASVFQLLQAPVNISRNEQGA